jgi:hypothetical protein
MDSHVSETSYYELVLEYTFRRYILKDVEVVLSPSGLMNSMPELSILQPRQLQDLSEKMIEKFVTEAWVKKL